MTQVGSFCMDERDIQDLVSCRSHCAIGLSGTVKRRCGLGRVPSGEYNQKYLLPHKIKGAMI